jgi:dipeptidyl aminopeptidase/acylaminoacyl peptidase
MLPFSRLVSWPAVLAMLSASGATGQQHRPMAVDDLFALEQLGTVTASPEGEWLAVVIARARTSAEKYQRYASDGDVDHADIWLVSRRGGKHRNITNGLANGSGYWNPVWSPDGQRLAMLSTQGTDRNRPHVYVWEMATGTLRRLTDRGADLGAYGSKSLVTYGMTWSDSTTLLCPVEPEDPPPMGYRVMGPPGYAAAVREWAVAERGLRPTVSALESGRELVESERPTGRLLALDVASGESRVIAEGNFRQLLMSPTRRHLALIAETGRISPRPDRKIPYGDRFRELWRTRLLILSLVSGRKAIWIDSVIDPKLSVGDAPHSWSLDGSSFAVIGKHDTDAEAARTLWVVSAADGAARRVTDSELEVSSSAWSRGGALLASARARSQDRIDGDASRLDWWAVSPTRIRSPRKLTLGLKTVPTTLAPTPEHRTMLGIAAGDLWAIDVHNGATRNLTDTFEPEIEDEIWPTGIQRKAGYHDQLVVQTRQHEIYRVEWTAASARLTRFPRPWKGAELAEFRPGQQLAVFTGASPNGTFLWTGDGNSDQFKERIALNSFVGQIADPKRMLIHYRGIDGDSLKAVLILPVIHESGRRYPLITWIYPAWIATDTISFSFLYDKQSVSSLNLHLLLSHGYALLIPTVPMPPDGQASDVYTELPKGVIPAVDRAIDLGIADPERLGVMGHSFGGYSTYSLVTSTNRFKAAVSIAGPSNLVSLYGTFWASQRYHDYPHEELFQPALSESGQLRMGTTPWDDLWRYIRNSPISYADRVQTPLMIIQGDLDYVPIQQGEEFFTALYRLGKKAKFVRYWGEGHTIESNANIRDMWQQMLTWFDEHLKEEGPPAPISGTAGPH